MAATFKNLVCHRRMGPKSVVAVGPEPLACCMGPQCMAFLTDASGVDGRCADTVMPQILIQLVQLKAAELNGTGDEPSNGTSQENG